MELLGLWNLKKLNQGPINFMLRPLIQEKNVILTSHDSPTYPTRDTYNWIYEPKETKNINFEIFMILYETLKDSG